MFVYSAGFQLLIQPLNDWDVGNVTDMDSYVFAGSNFNQALDDWDVSSVTDMGGMFSANFSIQSEYF